MAPRSFARVSDLLPSVLRDLGLQKRFSERRVVEQWSTVVGPALAKRTRALRCESGVLTVHVDHGAWMQELLFIEKKLLAKMQTACPDVALKQIRFTARNED